MEIEKAIEIVKETCKDLDTTLYEKALSNSFPQIKDALQTLINFATMHQAPKMTESEIESEVIVVYNEWLSKGTDQSDMCLMIAHAIFKKMRGEL